MWWAGVAVELTRSLKVGEQEKRDAPDLRHRRIERFRFGVSGEEAGVRVCVCVCVVVEAGDLGSSCSWVWGR